LRFYQYLNEATGDGGRRYEDEITAKLKAAGLTPPGFSPAYSRSDMPDCVFLYNGTYYNLELKLSIKNVDYGQLTMVKDGKVWRWASKNKDLMDIYDEIGVLDIANREWKDTPRRFTVSKLTDDDVAYDKAHFRDRYIHNDRFIDAMHKHYRGKNTYYIQISNGYGFYHLYSDPANIGTEQFRPILNLRLRRKPGFGSYNFVAALVMHLYKRPKKSKFNLDKDISFLGVAKPTPKKDSF